MTRMRRSLYSLAAMYLNTLLLLVSGLITLPILVKYLGQEQYGLSRTMFEWIAYTMLFSTGLDGVLNVRFAKALAQNDRAATLAEVRGGFAAYLRVALYSCAWVVGLIAFAPVLFNLDTATPGMEREVRLGLALAFVGMASLVLGPFKPLADAEQRGYVTQLATILGTFCGLVCAIGLSWSGYGLPGQIFSLMVPPCVVSVVLAVDGIRRYPELLRRTGARSVRIRAINWDMILMQLSGRIALISDCILITLILGTGPVALFSVTQRLILLLLGIVNGLGASTWAALADLHHRGESEVFNRRLIQLTRLTALLAAAAFVPAACWNGPFVRAWSGDADLFGGPTLSLLTGFAATLISVATLWGWPLMTLGRVRQLLPMHIAGTLTGLLVAVVATHSLGAIGPPLGTLANLLLVLGWREARLLEREFGTSMKSLLKAAAGPILLAVPYAFMILGASELLDVDTFRREQVLAIAERIGLPPAWGFRAFRMLLVAGLIGVCSAGFLAVAFATIIPVADRNEFLGRFRRRKP